MRVARESKAALLTRRLAGKPLRRSTGSATLKIVNRKVTASKRGATQAQIKLPSGLTRKLIRSLCVSALRVVPAAGV